MRGVFALVPCVFFLREQDRVFRGNLMCRVVALRNPPQWNSKRRSAPISVGRCNRGRQGLVRRSSRGRDIWVCSVSLPFFSPRVDVSTSGISTTDISTAGVST